MPDPISIAGIVLQLGSLLKQLYDYGKSVKSAQKDILHLCTELGALKSILGDVQAARETDAADGPGKEFLEMLSMAHGLVDSLCERFKARTSLRGKAMQSLKFPFDEDALTSIFAKLERLKSWFLLSLMTEQQSMSRSLQANVEDLKEIVQDDIAERNHYRKEQGKEKLHNFLAPVSPNAAHRRACECWKGSGPSSWFVDRLVTLWLSNTAETQRVLILDGKSGAGKTTLLSQAIEEAKARAGGIEGVSVAFFYCSYNETSSQETRNVLGSWLWQIANQQKLSLAKFERFSKNDNEDEVFEAIQRALLEVTGTVFLTLDAVNESSEADKLLRCVSRLASGPADIRCLISTTMRSHQAGSDFFRIEMRSELVAPAIEAYIRAKRLEHEILRAIPEVEFTKALLPRADGMFRWVDCQMDILSE